MKYAFQLSLLLFLSIPLTLTAQTPDQLTELDFGNLADSQMDRLHAVGGKLYASYSYLNFADGGPIRAIDLRTGIATSLIPADRGSRFQLPNPGTSPTVYQTAGQMFAIIRDPAIGAGLYRISNGRETRLHTNPEGRYSQIVASGGAYFFLSNTDVYGRYPGVRYQKGSTQLLVSTGMADGASVVADLPYAPSPWLLELIPTSDGFALAYGGKQGVRLYHYALASDELRPLRINGRPLVLQEPILTSLDAAPPLLHYEDGHLYFYGSQTGQDEGAHLYRSDLASLEVTKLTTGPLAEETITQRRNKKGQLFSSGGALYLIESNGLNHTGMNAYRVDAVSGITPVEQLSNYRTHRLLATPLATEESLYFLTSPAGVPGVVAMRFDANGVEPVADLTDVTFTGKRFASAGKLYLQTREGRDLGFVAIDLQERTVTRISSPWFTEGQAGQYASVGGDLFYLKHGTADDPAQGLFRWDGRNPSFVPHGNHRAGKIVDRTRLHGVDINSGNVLLRQNGEELIYQAETGEVAPLRLPGSVEHTVVGARRVSECLLVTGKNNALKYRDYVVRDGDLVMPTFTLPDGRNIDGNNTSTRFVFTDGTAVIRLDGPARSAAGYSFALLTMDGPQRGRIRPIDDIFGAEMNHNASHPEPLGDDHFYAASPGDSPGERTFHVWKATGESVGTHTAKAGSRVEGVTENYVFLTVPAEAVGQFTVRVVDRRTGGTVASLDFPLANELHYHRVAYPLGDRLLFFGNSLTTGRELFVMDPNSTAVTLLADLQPGPGYGSPSGQPVLFNGRLYFRGNDGRSGSELFVTDGTNAGTRLVSDINPGAASAFPSNLTVVGDGLYFTAAGPRGHELYQLAAGQDEPTLVVDLKAGQGSSFPYDLAADGQRLFFMAVGDGMASPELHVLSFDLVNTTAANAAPAKLYPNPVAGNALTVEAPSNELISKYEIFSVTGRRAINGTVMDQSSVRIDPSELVSGQYWMVIYYTSGKRGLSTFQVQHVGSR